MAFYDVDPVPNSRANECCDVLLTLDNLRAGVLHKINFVENLQPPPSPISGSCLALDLKWRNLSTFFSMRTSLVWERDFKYFRNVIRRFASDKCQIPAFALHQKISYVNSGDKTLDLAFNSESGDTLVMPSAAHDEKHILHNKFAKFQRSRKINMM